MTSPNSVDPGLFERVLRSAAPTAFLDQLCLEHNLKFRGGIYSVAVVIWLMIYQRLNSKGTLSSAVQFLARHAVHWQAQENAPKRHSREPDLHPHGRLLPGAAQIAHTGSQ